MKKSAFVICVLAASFHHLAIAKTLTVGVDLSSSNPLVSSETFARSAALYVADHIRKLQMGDVIEIRRIGDNRVDNLNAEKIQISRRNRADKVAQSVAQYISNLPKKTYDQESTNILSFLEFQNFGCRSGGKIILLTDGVEYSTEASDPEGILIGKKSFPAPNAGFLSGCEAIFYGLGQTSAGSMPSAWIRNLQNAWAAYMKTAGATFTAIVNP